MSEAPTPAPRGFRRPFVPFLLLLLPASIAILVGFSAVGDRNARPNVDFVVDDTTIDECRAIAGAGEDPIPCYSQALGNIAVADGPRVALERFVAEMKAVRLLDASCHPVAHRIGAAGLAHTDGDIGLAFVGGDSSCASGYYHGVIEDALAGVGGEPDPLWSRAADLCRSAPVQASPYLADQCYHGLGHGLMLATGYNLPAAFDVCTRFDEPREALGCYTGSFMENFARFAADDINERSPWVNDDDLGSTCAGLRGRWQVDAADACYAALAYRIWARSLGQAPWSEYVSLCGSIEPRYQPPCYNGFGRQVYTRYAGIFESSLAQMRDACLIAPPEGAVACISSVASHVTYTDSDGLRAARFCDLFEEGSRARCFSGIGDLLASFGGDAAALEARCAAVAVRDEDLISCQTAEIY